ncbi:MAG TPA: pseudoazurin [Gammaproteobacteria bacterium]
MNARRMLFGLAAAATLVAMPALGADHTVKMLNQGSDGMMVFEPAFLKVAPGDTVTFVPTDVGHNSTSVVVPEGAESWQGTYVGPTTVTLNQEGVYIYKCDPHVMMAMVGVIQVGDATNLAAAEKKAEEMKSGFVVAQERLDGYLDQVK